MHATPDEACGVADDQEEALLDESWPPEHVALLATSRRHPEQMSRQDLEGQDGYWDSYWDEELIFYGHVLGFKGLERRAVVLCVNGRHPRSIQGADLRGSLARHRPAPHTSLMKQFRSLLG